MKSIFVTGFWRSGTSLMLRLLDGHPQVYCMPVETGIITVLEKYPDFLDQLKACKDEYHLLSLWSQNPITRFNDIIQASMHGMSFSLNQIFYPFEFSFKAFSEKFFSIIKRNNNINDIIYGYFESIREGWMNCKFSENANVYAKHRGHRINLYPGEDSVRFVSENVENMVIIEMVRDPIYQIGSVLKNVNFLNMALEKAIVDWGYSYGYIWHRNDLYPSIYKMIRYEDLVVHTAETMKCVTDFAGIRNVQTLSEPTFNGQPWKGNSTFGELNRLVLRKDTHLQVDQIHYIERSLGHYRKELGYPSINDIL